MEILICLILIISLIAIIRIKNKNSNSQKQFTKKPLRELVKETFPKYKIIEKSGTIMICEINHRNEPDELVFIRINPNGTKKIKQSGRMLIADYPFAPSKKELKTDFGRHLN